MKGLLIEVSWIQPLSVSVYTVDKLHAQLPAKMCSIHLFQSQTQNMNWQNRDFDPRLCERQVVKSNFCLLLLSHFRNEVKLFALSWIHVDVFCLFLREEGAKSELHFAVRVCCKCGSKSVCCLSSQLLLTSCGYLRFAVGLVTSCGSLRKGFWSSFVWNFLRIKRNLTLFSPLACSCGARTSCATSCACIIFGLYCSFIERDIVTIQM